MTAPLKQAPYGEPSFQMVRKLGYAYVDKTQFIPVLENCGTRFPFIVRPRRFGKSLFANMLMAYYDKAAAGILRIRRLPRLSRTCGGTTSLSGR